MEQRINSALKSIVFEKTVLNVLYEYNVNLLFYKRIDRADNVIFVSDGFITKKLDLTCFDKDAVVADNIYIEIKMRNIRDIEINSLIKKCSISSRTENPTKNCLVLIINGNKPNGFTKLSEKYNIILIDKTDLVKNSTIKKVIEDYDDYILGENESGKKKSEINELVEANYKILNNCKNNISFALGAGCSINSNISDWNQLSKTVCYELLYTLVTQDDSSYKKSMMTNQIIEQLFNCYDKTSALDAVYQFYKDKSIKNEYYCSVKKALYMSYDSPNDADNPLMKSIKNCIKKYNVSEIINYIFDSVLEQCYNKKYTSTTNEIEKAQTIIGNCIIHHVHGYIPYDYDGKVRVKNLIFLDAEYYENMMNARSIPNKIQLEILMKYNVIFVGISFTDQNIKSLLRKRMKKNPTNKIFGFMKLPTLSEKGSTLKELEAKYRIVQQTYFDTLGVIILWVNDYNEIPERINNL